MFETFFISTPTSRVGVAIITSWGICGPLSVGFP